MPLEFRQGPEEETYKVYFNGRKFVVPKAKANEFLKIVKLKNWSLQRVEALLRENFAISHK